MQRQIFLSMLVALSAALAGCAGNGDADPTPATNTTPATPASSPAATPASTPATPAGTPAATPGATPATTPAATPPATPVVTPPPTGAAPTVTAVYVTSLTDSLPAPGTANACWRVEGTGTIPHTALHYDNESHPNATDFGQYDLGAVYPDNGPAAGRTFALPATFCATVPANETTYLRPHALAPGTTINTLGAEKVVLVDEDRPITFVNYLEIFPATFGNNVCWSIPTLTGTTTHTAVHFDDVSHPNATGFGEYDLGASYPENFTASNVSIALPDTEICATVDMPDTGTTLYMRAHVIHNGTHYLSEERNVRSAPRVVVSAGLPETAAANSMVEVCWRAEGAGNVTHTALHWDTTSHPTATAFGDYVGGAVYPDNGPATGVVHALPGPFCADLTMPASGTLYFRPHVIYPGQELGPEYAIRVA